ncbi:isochorismatase family protein [Arsenicicoccus bolidensis]|uniref:isochorismatase family protein n=1 Tax=Arsenicicoccus bolidensis TaxID=229480 RepID=UPI0004215198|nr:isochorismatase family protein [Arsenicicoccus bolidensis]
MTDTTAALLVVDVQRDVMAESINSDAVIGNVRTLVDRARDRSVPVIWVRHNADQELVLGSDGWQIVSELDPGEEPVVDKRYGDAFADTDLEDQLRQVGAQEVVLCGAQTDACIRSTFYGGLYRGYPMTLVADAHTTGDLRQWGAEYAPEQAINMLNLHADNTVLPGVRGSVTTTADALGG